MTIHELMEALSRIANQQTEARVVVGNKSYTVNDVWAEGIIEVSE